MNTTKNEIHDYALLQIEVPAGTLWPITAAFKKVEENYPKAEGWKIGRYAKKKNENIVLVEVKRSKEVD